MVLHTYWARLKRSFPWLAELLWCHRKLFGNLVFQSQLLATARSCPLPSLGFVCFYGRQVTKPCGGGISKFLYYLWGLWVVAEGMALKEEELLSRQRNRSWVQAKKVTQESVLGISQIHTELERGRGRYIQICKIFFTVALPWKQSGLPWHRFRSLIYLVWLVPSEIPQNCWKGIGCLGTWMAVKKDSGLTPSASMDTSI